MKVRWLLLSPSARLPTCSKRNHTKTGGDAKEGWNIVTVKMPGTIGPLHFLHFFIHFVHCPLFSTFNDSTHCHPFSSIVIHFHPISLTVIPRHPISSNVIQLDFRVTCELSETSNPSETVNVRACWCKKTNTCRWLWLRWLWEEIEGRRWAWNSIGPALVSAKSRWKG